MLKYTLKRIAIGVMTMFVLITVTFFLMKIMPGSPFSSERNMSPDLMKRLNERYGLDQPLFVQYTRYLGNLLRGDLGESLVKKGRMVSDVIRDSAGVTMKLGTVAAIFSMIVGITLGLIAAFTKKKWVNNLVMVIVTLGISVPGFLLALLMMIVFGVNLGWLPTVSYELTQPAQFVMPVIALSFYPIAMISRLIRSSMLEVQRQDYMVLARAKGLSPLQVTLNHGLKNAILPVVTYAGPMVAYLLTGSFVVESLFTISGIGKEFVSSVTNRDYALIMGLTIFLGALVIVINIIVDLISVLIDPRIKIDG